MLKEYFDKKVDDAVHKINAVTSDYMEKDIFKEYQKLENRVSNLEEFSKQQDYVLKVGEEEVEYKAD